MSSIVRDWRTETAQGRRAARREAASVRVALAGGGMITALGKDASTTWEAMLRGEWIADHAIVAKQWGGRSRVAGLAIDAAAEAIEDAGWTEKDVRSAALVVGTSKGKIVNWIEGGQCGAGVGDLAHDVADEFGFDGGPRLTLSAACASGLHALIRGALMIKSGEAQRVLVVAAEGSVHELFIGSFRRLGVLAKGGAGCRPFDARRSGFLMSEAGVAVCLEAVESGDDAEGQVLVERMALGGDATDMVGGDPEGQTLRHLLVDVVGGRKVDLIHAHGTGTIRNDRVELDAIGESFVGELKEDSSFAPPGLSAGLYDTPGSRPGLSAAAPPGLDQPALYSHKAALGHSLGAAGLVSVVINRLCHCYGIVPPSLVEEPMPTRNVTLSNHPQRRPIHRSVTIAAGFGGATGVVSLVSA